MMQEIVAILYGSNKTITNNPAEIIKVMESGIPFQSLTRQHMAFMSACDLGRKWDNLANGRTLWLEDMETGKVAKADKKSESEK